MIYGYEVKGSWIRYCFVGTGFCQTWTVSLQLITTGVRLGVTGRTSVILPHERRCDAVRGSP